ncbi:hypothetical protein TSAR_002081 [Trichomalopsis sarcophagae]|uniref:Ionotropic glutamate receptor C-terminal domain-containing protein n=1 Tax=Trichomalopsis sarcophagae TaxID=543379 RepID=A0A232FE60_9HYME|nr:hypothetical protein TSAR_002081 [Trichomalopsis sarcophagae]
MIRQESYFKLKNYPNFRTEHALIYDSVKIFAEGFKRLKSATKGNLKKIVCNKTESWEHGISLNNFIKSVEIKGLTGPICFDNAGFRSNFEIGIFSLEYSGIKETGKWNSSKNVEWFINTSSGSNQDSLSLHNTTFRVLIALTKPYGMLKETVSKMSGNEQYEGFAIDIIHEISKMLGFNYTFSVQMDNVYGSLNQDTKQWNGMLRKIIDDEADLAITDLTITEEREKAVDFTMPFMNLGISILYQKPKAAPPSLMSFLLPFSTNVWLYLIGVYIVVSTLFFVIGRMCPAEWNNVYPCIEDPDELENQFTFRNSLWFCIGAVMQQGSEIAPIGNSTRMLAGCWWFFCLIIANSYTANLAAFLTVETIDRPIKNVDGLANQNIIKYGAKKGGSTLDFFKYMIANEKEVLTADNDEGKKKVLTENYAFLMESSSIEYIQERECNLSQIGGLLDQKGYGIAMKKSKFFVVSNNVYEKHLNICLPLERK